MHAGIKRRRKQKETEQCDGMMEKWRHKVMSILKSFVIKCRQF